MGVKLPHVYMTTRTKEIFLVILIIIIGAWLVYYQTVYVKRAQKVDPPTDQMTADEQINILNSLEKQSTTTMTTAESIDILEKLEANK